MTLRAAWSCRAATAAALLAAGGLALGQPAGGSPAPTAPPPPAPTITPAPLPPMIAPPIKDLCVQSLVRTILTDLRADMAAKAEDYRIALIVLRQVMKLAPDDEQILRLAIDAAEQAGDTKSVGDLTRQLIRMVPEDTVAQLTLITLNIAEMQSLDERLRAYERLLGPQGARLDQSVRSRLALDAALLCRERGDLAGFAKRLAEATQLDSTNKDAAAMAYALYAARVDDAEGRLELLINLLNADPLDRSTHLELARLLASVGAAAASERFYATAMAIDEAVGAKASVEIAGERAIVTWEHKGPLSTVRELNAAVRDARAEIEGIRQQLTDSRRPLDGVPVPEDVRLDLVNDRLRLMSAVTLNDEGTITEAVNDIIASVKKFEEYIAKPDTAPKTLTPEMIATQRDRWRVECPLLLLVADRRVQDAAAMIGALNAPNEKPVSAATMARLEGWLYLRRGELDAAQGRLLQAPADDAGAQLGLAQIAELRGESAKAVEIYTAIWRGAADSWLGAFARTMAFNITGVRPDPAPVGLRLGAMADGIPKWVDDVCVNPRQFMSLSAMPVKTIVGPLDPIRFTIRLRNTSQIPLALGEGKPIQSRMMLTPSVQTGIYRVPAFAEVFRLDRRLRLMPREELKVTVWADPGYGGWVIDNLRGLTTRMNFRLLQGFETNGTTTRQGARSLAFNAEQVMREPIGFVNSTTDEVIAAVLQAKDAQWLHAVAAAQTRIRSRDSLDPIPADDAKRLAVALGQRYIAEGPMGRLFLLLRVPATPSAAEFDAVAKATLDVDETVLLAKVLVRCNDPKDPLLQQIKDGPAGDLRDAAVLHQQRLAAGARVFANMALLKAQNAVSLPALQKPDENLPAVKPLPEQVNTPGGEPKK